MALHPLSLLTCLVVFSVALLTPAYSACALEAEEVESSYEEKQFRCEMTALLDAPVAAVQAVLRDYEQYPSLDARILEARILERPTENTAMLETILRACFGPFCRNVKRVEEVVETAHGLAAITDPTRSDVRFGETHTSIEAVGESQTRVIYRTSIVPGFWVPALGARRWMLTTLEQATVKLFENVESRAQVDSAD